MSRPHDGIYVTNYAGAKISGADLWLEIGRRDEAAGPVVGLHYGDERVLDLFYPAAWGFPAHPVYDPALPADEVRFVHEDGAQTRLIRFTLPEDADVPRHD